MTKPAPLYLRRAVAMGKAEEVARLLAEGADSGEIDSDGNSLLMKAADGDHLEVVQLLLAEGLDINQRNIHNNTALLLAMLDSDNRKAARLLVDNGADVNAQNNAGATALIWAVRENDADMTGFLLTHGADAGLQDKEGRTARAWAEKNGFTACLEKLTEKEHNRHESAVARQGRLRVLANQRKRPNPRT